MAVPTLEEIASAIQGRVNPPSYEMYVKGSEIHKHLKLTGCFTTWGTIHADLGNAAIGFAAITGLLGAIILHVLIGVPHHLDSSYFWVAIAFGITSYLGFKQGLKECSKRVAEELPEGIMAADQARNNK